MTDKDKYLIELFDKYNEILEHCNKPCKNMYSKDEFWARHTVFKGLQKDMRSYSFKIFILNTKLKIRNFFDNIKQKIRNFFGKFKRKKNKQAECIDQSEPTDPTVQSEQTDQSEPTDPTDLTVQSEQTVQSEPTDPATQTDPTGLTVQSKQPDQSEPTTPPGQTKSKIKKRRGRPRKNIIKN